jgi:hypothetical protein
MAVKSATPLKQGEIVRAKVALRGVPVSTKGKVIMVSGLTWIRYWVWFDNGERVGTIDRSKLMTAEEFDRQQAGGDELVVAAAAGGSTAAAVSSDSGGSVLESVNGIPGILVERSRLAREKWAAKHG